MEQAPLFSPESEESDMKFRELLKARGFEGKAAESVIDRTRGDEVARQRWFDAYGHLLPSTEDPEDSEEDNEEDNIEETTN